MKPVGSIFVFLLAVFLYACDRSNGDTSAKTSYQFQNARAAPGDDGANPKQLRLTWTIDAQPHHYRVELNPDGASGFAPLDTGEIAGDAASVELETALHLRYWEAARYQLVALDAQGEELARSAEIPVAQVPVEPMIGRLRATNSGPADSALNTGDLFGDSLAISGSGNILAVGKPGDASGSADPDDDSQPGAGAVFVYEDTGTGWKVTYLKGNSPIAGDAFGSTVAMSGDGNWLAVSAPGENYPGETFFGGALYLFERSGDRWLQRNRIALDPEIYPASRFPFNLALSQDGNVLAAGDIFEAVFVYSLESGRVMETQVVPRNAEDGNRAFAQSLALSASGDRLAVGAMTVAQASDPGAVYIYERAGGEWQQTSVIEGSAGPGFASALALSAQGDLLAVADINDHHIGSGVNPPRSVASFAVSGAVYLLRESAGQWQEEAFIKATNNPLGTNSSSVSFPFGASLALSADGNVLVVGAPKESSAATGVSAAPSWDDSMRNAGSAYLFLRENGTWREGNYIKPPETGCGKHFGSTAAISADGRSLALAAVPFQGAFAKPDYNPPTGAAFTMDACEGQAMEEYPLNGAVYLY